MRKIGTWAKRGLFVVSPLALLLSMSVSAAGPADRDVSPKIREAMQRDLGLSPAQLAQYLKVERLATGQHEVLAKTGDDRFAGSWLERKPNGDYQLVVASTSIAPKRGMADVEFRNVRHSLGRLSESKAELDTLAERGAKVPKGVYGWFVDVQSNAVTVNVAPGAQFSAIDFVASSGADAETIRFFVARAHYRSPLNYSDVHLDDARQALKRLYTALAAVPQLPEAGG